VFAASAAPASAGVAREFRAARVAPRDTPLDAAQRHPYRGAQTLGGEQALRQVIHGTELQRAYRGELVPFFGECDDRRRSRLVAQPAQQRQSVRARVLGTHAEGGRQHKQVAVAP